MTLINGAEMLDYKNTQRLHALLPRASDVMTS